MTDQWWTTKGLGGSGRVLIWGTVSEFTWSDWREERKILGWPRLEPRISRIQVQRFVAEPPYLDDDDLTEWQELFNSARQRYGNSNVFSNEEWNAISCISSFVQFVKFAWSWSVSLMSLFLPGSLLVLTRDAPTSLWQKCVDVVGRLSVI
jgi:hypothetical protein